MGERLEKALELAKATSDEEYGRKTEAAKQDMAHAVAGMMRRAGHRLPEHLEHLGRGAKAGAPRARQPGEARPDGRIGTNAAPGPGGSGKPEAASPGGQGARQVRFHSFQSEGGRHRLVFHGDAPGKVGVTSHITRLVHVGPSKPGHSIYRAQTASGSHYQFEAPREQVGALARPGGVRKAAGRLVKALALIGAPDRRRS